MKLRNILYILLITVCSLPALAVSDKDMEQAKVIAAKLYLRWTNNGSGYLDEVSASSMADLESKLKDAEKENLKAFKSVSIPSDYASWDKERFVQFWGTTFFTSPALTADGKRAKDRVKAKVSALKVAAPTAKAEAPKSEEAKPEEKKEDEKKEEPTSSQQSADEAISIPEPQEVMHQEEAVADSLHVLQAEEQSLALPEERKKAKSNTWIYIIILVVLVILVVWLMIYAANMMKSQGKEVREVQGSDKKAKKQIETLEAENSRLKKEIARLNEAIQSRLAAHDALKTEADAAKAEAARMRVALKKAEERPALSEQAPAPAPRRQEEPKPQQPKILNEIYLGRANAKGLFVRGDRRPNPGHTIYRLDTKDGIVGTFRVLNSPESFELAVSNPLQFLAGGCVCENFEEAETADKIVTETPGTAILENGCWKVLRKSRIRFE
ncbi:MAG: hypothetical protein HDS03_03405 [Bacteroides sp.]|nr:hypothetical protein [Bacteroides sp.]